MTIPPKPYEITKTLTADELYSCWVEYFASVLVALVAGAVFVGLFLQGKGGLLQGIAALLGFGLLGGLGFSAGRYHKLLSEQWHRICIDSKGDFSIEWSIGPEKGRLKLPFDQIHEIRSRGLELRIFKVSGKCIRVPFLVKPDLLCQQLRKKLRLPLQEKACPQVPLDVSVKEIEKDRVYEIRCRQTSRAQAWKVGPGFIESASLGKISPRSVYLREFLESNEESETAMASLELAGEVFWRGACLDGQDFREWLQVVTG